MNKTVSCLLLVLFGLLTEFSNSQRQIIENEKGQIDGYSYEFWKDSGDTEMVLLGNGTFSCSWKNINNALFRIGKKLDCNKLWYEYESITVNYDVDFRQNGNTFMGIHGWFKNPLFEFYIVENWGSWKPPGKYSIGTIYIDDGQYDVYNTDVFNQPTFEGYNTNFKQYWFVRTNKRSKGTISLHLHFFL